MNEKSKLRFRPSSKIIRIVYALVLLLTAAPIIFNVRYSWVLFKQMPTNPNVINPITATVTFIIAVIVTLVAGYRVIGLATNNFKLELLVTSGPIHVLRIFSIAFMCAGLFIFLLTVSGGVITGFLWVALMIGGEFKYLMPVGIILFEFSRLLERELFLERKT